MVQFGCHARHRIMTPLVSHYHKHDCPSAVANLDFANSPGSPEHGIIDCKLQVQIPTAMVQLSFVSTPVAPVFVASDFEECSLHVLVLGFDPSAGPRLHSHNIFRDEVSLCAGSKVERLALCSCELGVAVLAAETPPARIRPHGSEYPFCTHGQSINQRVGQKRSYPPISCGQFNRNRCCILLKSQAWLRVVIIHPFCLPCGRN